MYRVLEAATRPRLDEPRQPAAHEILPLVRHSPTTDNKRQEDILLAKQRILEDRIAVLSLAFREHLRVDHQRRHLSSHVWSDSLRHAFGNLPLDYSVMLHKLFRG